MAIEQLVEPSGSFRWFYPHNEDGTFNSSDPKLKEFVGHLMKKDRYVSDELRNYDSLWQMVFQMFTGGQLNIIYELGDFQGFVGFLNIIPSWKCRVMFKIWDKEAWNRKNVRDGRKLIASVFDTFNLIRMESHTADPVMERLAGMFGFEKEGTMFKSFKWNGRIYDLILLSKIREE